MYKIAFVIPYFGKFPEMFELWLESAKNNTDIDFLLFSDFPKGRQYKLSNNIKCFKMSFKSLKERVDKTMGFTTALTTPYKLCDFKPAYGDIFKEELRGYDFWGFCDIDLIFGDIRKFITDELLEKYDKIGSLGHCVIIRNDDFMRTMYKRSCKGECPYKIIYMCKANFNFDEGGQGQYGFPNICEEHGVRTIWRRWFTDIYTETFEFRHKQYFGDKPYYRKIKYAYYDNGRLFIKNEDDESEFESMYIHFQGRKMKHSETVGMMYYMIANRFSSELQEPFENFKDEVQLYNKNKKVKKMVAAKRKIRLGLFLVRQGKIVKKGWRKYIL